MKSVFLTTVLACLALSGAAQAAPVLLSLELPDTDTAYGTGADNGNGPLPVSFNATGAITLTEFTWWGYHLLTSSGSDQFEIVLNGTTVGSQSLPQGTITAADTNSDLTDPLAAPGAAAVTVNLMRYTLVFDAGVQSMAGINTLSVVNEDSGAIWFWQGTGTGNDPYLQSAYSLTGEQALSVPEPGSLLLVLGALAAAGAVVRRRA